MTETEKAALRDIMEMNQRSRDALLLRYGRGVRPSWVSVSLGLYEDRIERARRTLGGDRMTKWENASFLRRCTSVQFKGIRLGSINDVGHNITDKEALWLLTNAEKHNMSVAEWLSGLVSDAYWEENEDGN